MSRVTALQDFWNGLATRERSGIALAAAAVTLTLLWWLTLAPALKTLSLAETQATQLEAQLQAMRALQAQAKALQSQPKLGRDEALRALESSIKQRLGANAQFTVQGDSVNLVLKGASADALAQWLALARVNARALPSQARLQRSVSTGPNTSGVAWDGSLVLSLPAQ
jgi:general secretion pathway protein M